MLAELHCPLACLYKALPSCQGLCTLYEESFTERVEVLSSLAARLSAVITGKPSYKVGFQICDHK